MNTHVVKTLVAYGSHRLLCRVTPRDSGVHVRNAVMARQAELTLAELAELRRHATRQQLIRGTQWFWEWAGEPTSRP